MDDGERDDPGNRARLAANKITGVSDRF